MTDFKDCCRCGEAPAVTQDRLCSHCTWAIQAEVSIGFAQLRDYLAHWLAYEIWCESHAVAP